MTKKVVVWFRENKFHVIL